MQNKKTACLAISKSRIVRSKKKAFCKDHYLAVEAIFRNVFPGGSKTVPHVAVHKRKVGEIDTDELSDDQTAYLQTVNGITQCTHNATMIGRVG